MTDGVSRKHIVPARRVELLWTLAAASIVALAALIPLAFNSWFYLYADTPEGAYGQWYVLGEKLLAGQWPLLEVEAWRAGNWVAEGQWGLWNPLVLAMGIFVYVSPSVLLASNVIKIFFLALAAAGVFRATRVFGASTGWSFVAAVAAPFAGFTLFMDATSWVTNLMTWAFFPWVLWAVHRFAKSGRGVLWVLIAGYLLVTIGYVQGTIMLIFMLAAFLVVNLARRDATAVWRALAVGVVLALVAVAVYLPGLLTSPVTSRAATIGNDGFMVYTFTALASSSNPSALADLAGWWGRFPTVPYTYIAWFIPLIALVDIRLVRKMDTRLWVPVVFLAFALLYSMAPSVMGPLQFPSRTLPWIAFSVIMLLCVALSSARVERIGRRWIPVVLIWGVGAYLAVAQVPSSWRISVSFAILVLIALLVTMRALRMDKPWRWGATRATSFMVVVTLGVLLGQAICYADNLHSRVDFPDDVTEYQTSLSWGEGDGFVVGVPPISSEAAIQESLIGNFWYLNPTHVHNLYSPVQFRNYSADLCMSHDGATCEQSLDKLFADDETTGVPLVDLLSLDTVQIIATPERDLASLERLEIPDGWELADVGQFSVTWTRVGEQTAAGGIVWQSAGVSAEVVSETDEQIRIRVDETPTGGGSLVFSRLAWPGYTVSDGSLSDPLRGYLLRVDLTEVAPGETITVSFQPPAWGAVVASMILAAIGAVLLTVLTTRSARRRTLSTATPTRSEDALEMRSGHRG